MNPPIEYVDARSATDAIELDLFQAAESYRLALAVAKRADESPDAIGWCPEFWRAAIYGMRDAAVLLVAKLYDRTNGSLSLSHWVKSMPTTVRRAVSLHNPNQLPRLDATIEKHHAEDLRSVGDDDPVVKRFRDFRNKRHCHRDFRLTIAPAEKPEPFTVTYREVAELIERAKVIFNRYSGAAFEHEVYFGTIGGNQDDTMAVDAMETYVAEQTYRQNVEQIGELMKLYGFD